MGFMAIQVLWVLQLSPDVVCADKWAGFHFWKPWMSEISPPVYLLYVFIMVLVHLIPHDPSTLCSWCWCLGSGSWTCSMGSTVRERGIRSSATDVWRAARASSKAPWPTSANTTSSASLLCCTKEPWVRNYVSVLFIITVSCKGRI